MNITSIYSRLAEPWLLTESAYVAMLQAISQLDAKSWGWPGEQEPKKSDSLPYSRVGSVAVVNVDGVLAMRPDSFEKTWLGMVALNELGDVFEAIQRDTQVSSALVTFNSPGGSAIGTPEAADKLRALNAVKPVVAFSDTMMASAAYQIGSQASLLLSSKTASIGSIGSMITIRDSSRMFKAAGIDVKVLVSSGSPLKGIGAYGAPLSKEQEAHVQSVVDTHGAMFRDQVRAARPGVKEEAMQGQSLFGQQAISLGLVDQHTDLAGAISCAAKLAGSKWK